MDLNTKLRLIQTPYIFLLAAAITLGTMVTAAHLLALFQTGDLWRLFGAVVFAAGTGLAGLSLNYELNDWQEEVQE